MNYPSETLDFTGFKNGNFPIKDGFYRDGIFKTFVYKDIIQLVIQFDNDEKWWKPSTACNANVGGSNGK